MSTPRKPFIVKAAKADAPPIVIPPGDYYRNTKERGKRMCLNSLSSIARRVYACLELHTVGYSSELAVKLVDGKRKPLTPADIAAETGLDPADVSHGLEELEAAGLAERRDDDGKGLRKGHIRIYSWAIPRAVGESKIVGARTNNNLPAWVESRPEDDPLRLFVNSEKLRFSPDFVVARTNIEAAEVAARAVQDAVIVARAALECCGARPSHIRRKHIETKGGNGSGSDFSKEQPSSSSSKTTTTIAGQQKHKNTPPPMPEAIWEEARRLTRSRSFPKSAVEDYWRLCQTLAGDRAPLDADAVTRIMQRTATAAGGSVNTFGYFPKSAADQVQAYLDHGAEEHVMAAGAGASEWDRLWAEVEAEES